MMLQSRIVEEFTHSSEERLALLVRVLAELTVATSERARGLGAEALAVGTGASGVAVTAADSQQLARFGRVPPELDSDVGDSELGFASVDLCRVRGRALSAWLFGVAPLSAEQLAFCHAVLDALTLAERACESPGSALDLAERSSSGARMQLAHELRGSTGALVLQLEEHEQLLTELSRSHGATASRIVGELRQLDTDMRYAVGRLQATLEDRFFSRSSHRERAAPASDDGPLRVLVIDDDTSFARDLHDWLQPHEVRSVVSASDAELTLSDPQYEPDLVLCAVYLLGADGHVVYRRTLARRPHLAARFVFTATLSQWDTSRELAEAAERTPLYKPVTPAALQPLLQAAVERRRGRSCA